MVMVMVMVITHTDTALPPIAMITIPPADHVEDIIEGEEGVEEGEVLIIMVVVQVIDIGRKCLGIDLIIGCGIGRLTGYSVLGRTWGVRDLRIICINGFAFLFLSGACGE